jgi:23S rRNA (adenine2030-N6)-methyltransferase
MNYRHIYHAGNFADVFKHVVLVSLIQSLSVKNTPFFYLDTHAGIGEYDLQQRNAQKTQEYKTGVGKCISHPGLQALPVLLRDYITLLETWNHAKGTQEIRYYPGSPVWVRQLLRPLDRMVLTELHPEDRLRLKQTFLQDKQVAVHHLDGYQALKAFLPPKENRGLVLIDPPFEKTDEYTQIVQQLMQATNRWQAGTYAIWYPIKDKKAVKRFYADLVRSGIREILCCEMHVSDLEESAGLQACGMLLVHPPWQWQKKIEAALPSLSGLLSQQDRGSYRMKWLVPE